MKICFVLSAATRNISGGYKIVYEYANRLTVRGHKVVVMFDCSDDKERFRNKISLLAVFLYRKMIAMQEPTWFELNNAVKKRVVQELNHCTFDNYDAIILCGSRIVLEYFKNRKSHGNIFSLIQDFENWKLSDAEVEESFRKPTINIAVSKWLQNRVKTSSRRNCYLISNPLDLEIFGIDIEMAKRQETITMLYHEAERKGCKYGIQVMHIIHRKYPFIKFILFGHPKRPKELPEWITYYQQADSCLLRKIYNKTTIFMVSSIEEGYGLTGAESMACGCALVSTKTSGIWEYADNECAMLSEPRDVKGMADNIEILLNDSLRKAQIAKRGYQRVQKLSWSSAIDKMEKILENERIYTEK